MLTGIKIIRVATGTATAVGWTGPGHQLTVCPMAGTVVAAQGGAMSPWIERRTMGKDEAIPVAGDVAAIALLVGDEMAIILASGRGTVMTTGAVTCRIAVVKTSGQPCAGGVADTALRGGHHMLWVFTRGGGAVMTTGADGGNTTVVETCRAPASNGVATIALKTGEHVIG